MTAAVNTGAETIRIDRRCVPLLLQLKTTGAVGADEKTSTILARLEEATVLQDGALHPMVDAMLELIASPGLVVSVERMRVGTIAASTIWATPQGAVLGTRVDRNLFELKLIDAAMLPIHIFQMIHLWPRPVAVPFEHRIDPAALFAAEAKLYEGDRPGAVAALDDATTEAAEVVALLAGRIASWRIHSVWTTSRGSQNAEASGMDCGEHGHVLVSIGSENATMTIRSATVRDVAAAVRSTLPAASR